MRLRRYHIREPAKWIGKALCVRAPWASSVNKCSDLRNTCNCLPYLKKWQNGNVWLAADGVRYNVEMDLDTFEKSDPVKYETSRVPVLMFTHTYVCVTCMICLVYTCKTRALLLS